MLLASGCWIDIEWLDNLDGLIKREKGPHVRDTIKWLQSGNRRRALPFPAVTAAFRSLRLSAMATIFNALHHETSGIDKIYRPLPRHGFDNYPGTFSPGGRTKNTRRKTT
ncbi:MAG: hypothetical protein KKG88_08340 [Proteobacteria bacterium]|jgi:hypothetical protein|nr:hypothetical protein [Pseudomonadota bacterium]MBU4230295.1 hypothetical protein [Pseudomonadota bacterium]MCG2824936.1 hypothetical protein [Desulfobulbaceae bacterium]